MKLNVQGAELEITVVGQALLMEQLASWQSRLLSHTGIVLFSVISVATFDREVQFFDMIGLHCVGRANSAITASHMQLYPIGSIDWAWYLFY